MIGDQSNIFGRIKGLLPQWFGQDRAPTPVLDALLQGPAWAFAEVYSLYAFARLQTLISTSTGGWLDLVAFDFFGTMLQRRSAWSDAFYRAFILASIFRERATRQAIIKVVQDLTGRTPKLLESRRNFDGNSYRGVGGYNVGRPYGTAMSFQVFAEVYRPLAGSLQVGVSDADIYTMIDGVRAAAISVWVRILDNPMPAFRLGFGATVFSRGDRVYPSFAAMAQMASSTRYLGRANAVLAVKFNVTGMPAGGATAYVFAWTDGTLNNRIALVIDGTTGHLFFEVYTGGALQALLDMGAVSIANGWAFAVRLQTNDAAAVFGAAVVTDTSVAMPNPNQVDIGIILGAHPLAGAVVDLRGYNDLKTNAALQALAASL